MTPAEFLKKLYKGVSRESRLAMISGLILGLITHLPIMLSDIPNHDGLDSIYFDQNMITSGRWFLEAACGVSSFFTLPWVIGVISLILLSITAGLLINLLEIKNPVFIVLSSGIIVAFPTLVSNFAYVFTMDGYMLGLLLAVAAVYITKKNKYGFILGGILLGFSLGIYQAYLSVAILLSLYMAVLVYFGQETYKEKIKGILHYLFMGIIGALFYLMALKLLLFLQSKKLADYQGISDMTNTGTVGNSLSNLLNIYRDFIAFSLKGKILANNIYSMCGLFILALLTGLVIFKFFLQKKGWKKVEFLGIIGVLFLIVPIGANIILIISSQVTYHTLMRYQWAVLLVIAIALCEKLKGDKGKLSLLIDWGVTLSCFVLVLNFVVTDNIAYGNLNKKYEKTYAYCMRLLDRIEQTEGYYQGIPIEMIGVVGDEEFPSTDLTKKVTENILGADGDYLLYTGENYKKFIKNYLGASLNILSADETDDFYYSEDYKNMDSFPGKNSVKCVDGVIYVKTENAMSK